MTKHAYHKDVRHPDFYKKEKLGVAKFNHKLARRMGGVLGSMGFFYFCIVLDLVMLPPVVRTGSTTVWVTYLAQTVIQLLALPLLQVYQNLQQEQNDAKAAADHHALSVLMILQDEQLEILKQLKGAK